MPKFSANISMLFTEHPFLDRFAAAKAAGFAAVECWFPYSYSKQEIATRLADLDLIMVGINTEHGADGKWGIAVLPGREQEFEASLGRALEHAAAYNHCAVHVMAGLAGHLPQEEALATYHRNLEHAVRVSEGSGIQLLIEPLNRSDRPGYLLHSADQAAELIERWALHSLRIMFDCYHVARQEGGLLEPMRRVWPKIGHIQIAGVPTRGSPSEGTVDYAAVFDEIDRLGWAGWVGAEYIPPGATHDSLAWMRAHDANRVAVPNLS